MRHVTNPKLGIEMNSEEKAIHVIPIAILKDNYVWIIINKDQQQAIVVDPGEAEATINYLDKMHLMLSAIFITHHHGDHTNGLKKLVQYANVPVFCSPLSPLVINKQPIHDHYPITVNNSFPPFYPLTIPGHTLDHIAYYGQRMLFCGDTLFAGGCGRAFEGTTDQLYTSLQRLAQLPSETLIYCGHEYTLANLQFATHVAPHNAALLKRLEYIKKLREKQQVTLPTSLEEEKQTNIFLRCDSNEIILAAEQYAGCKLTSAQEVFAVLRQWKNELS